MRRSARLLLAAAIGAAVLVPTHSANAMYCGALQPACSAVCLVNTVVGGYCLQ